MLMKTALIVGLLAVPGLALAGGNKALHGTWKATSMIQGKKETPVAKFGLEVHVTFHPSGKFSAVMKMGKNAKTETGTWSASSGMLHTVTHKKSGKSKKESLKYKLKGNTLLLFSPGGTMKFTRVKMHR